MPKERIREGGVFRHFRRGTAEKNGVSVTRDVTVASAALVSDKQIKRAVARKDWQKELWDYFDTIGELRYSVRWLANAISRCTLYVGEYTEEGSEPTPLTGSAAQTLPCQLLDDLYYGPIGQSDMLRRLSLHLSVPGESYLVGIDPDPEQGITEPAWYVASNEELKANGNKVTLIRPETGEPITLTPENSTVIRLWTPHPRNAWESDSAVRATIPVLREIKGLSDHIAATVDSRLAGAGIFVVPQGASLPTPAAADATAVQEDPDEDILGALTTAMLTAIEDRDDASAVVPIVIQVPDDSISKFQHINFSSELSDKVSQMRRDALERFATGADLPKEVVTGAGNANHWGAWQIEESSIKLHVEPLMAVICDALTRQYLWPALRTHGVQDPEQWVVWYNPSELSQRPNKSAESLALWDKGLLSDAATLRENGFAATDAPSPAEHQRWLAERLLLTRPSSSGLPQGTTAAEISAEDGYDRTAPALVAAITTDPGHIDPWWVSAVEQAALRVMELAGNRWLGRQTKRFRAENDLRSHPSWDLHTRIGDTPTIEEIDTHLLRADALAAAAVSFSPSVLNALDSYCRHLLTTRTSHSRALLTGWLVENGCTPASSLPTAA
ncbi:hypothetical protein [Nocardiopsis synnemataformans]|uniref:hypothetical protein n=1 Tax=Nocardiopsis synnemataformans TaxID=61305 RepID=UPI003EC0F39D